MMISWLAARVLKINPGRRPGFDPKLRCVAAAAPLANASVHAGSFLITSALFNIVK